MEFVAARRATSFADVQRVEVGVLGLGRLCLARDAASRSTALLSNLSSVSFSNSKYEGAGRLRVTISLVIRLVPSLIAWTNSRPSESRISRSHSSNFLFRGIESRTVSPRENRFGKSTFR